MSDGNQGSALPMYSYSVLPVENRYENSPTYLPEASHPIVLQINESPQFGHATGPGASSDPFGDLETTEKYHTTIKWLSGLASILIVLAITVSVAFQFSRRRVNSFVLITMPLSLIISGAVFFICVAAFRMKTKPRLMLVAFWLMIPCLVSGFVVGALSLFSRDWLSMMFLILLGLIEIPLLVITRLAIPAQIDRGC